MSPCDPLSRLTPGRTEFRSYIIASARSMLEQVIGLSGLPTSQVIHQFRMLLSPPPITPQTVKKPEINVTDTLAVPTMGALTLPHSATSPHT